MECVLPVSWNAESEGGDHTLQILPTGPLADVVFSSLTPD